MGARQTREGYILIHKTRQVSVNSGVIHATVPPRGQTQVACKSERHHPGRPSSKYEYIFLPLDGCVIVRIRARNFLMI